MRSCPGRRRWVYPRVCGGTDCGHCSSPDGRGLSPRVRGNPGQRRRRGVAAGSIPACAGEPAGVLLRRRFVRVYPRVCGGTPAYQIAVIRVDGLSPRVRGNLGDLSAAYQPLWSIPACAGEPYRSTAAAAGDGVYPRVCGGTGLALLGLSLLGGLSPRVRGNRACRRTADRCERSIPACAGEPADGQAVDRSDEVYPRVCGGTARPAASAALRAGLSPRVRGNRAVSVRQAVGARSIPACAGEPRSRRSCRAAPTVYPRVCGGTGAIAGAQPAEYGLSPRVRGNRIDRIVTNSAAGSIPACAGEPGARPSRPARGGVYPRVCGGTPHPRRQYHRDVGLSPRVRGNRKMS